MTNSDERDADGEWITTASGDWVKVASVAQLKAIGRKMLDEQRAAAHAKVDEVFDQLLAENMARLEPMERTIVGAALQ